MAQAGVGAAAHAHWRGDSIHDLIVPLVEDRQSPVAGGNPRQGEIALAIALSKGEVSAIRAAQAGEALGIAEGLARTAAVQSLVRRPAHACTGNLAFHDL